MTKMTHRGLRSWKNAKNSKSPQHTQLSLSSRLWQKDLIIFGILRICPGAGATSGRSSALIATHPLSIIQILLFLLSLLLLLLVLVFFLLLLLQVSIILSSPAFAMNTPLTTRYGGGGGALNQCKQYWWSPCQQYQLVNNTRRTIIRAPANPVPCPTLFTPVTRRQVWEIFKNRLKTQKRELEIIFIFWALFL